MISRLLVHLKAPTWNAQHLTVIVLKLEHVTRVMQDRGIERPSAMPTKVHRLVLWLQNS